MLFDGQVWTIQCSVDLPPTNINNDTKSSLLALQKDGKLVQRVLSAGYCCWWLPTNGAEGEKKFGFCSRTKLLRATGCSNCTVPEGWLQSLQLDF